MVRAAILGMPHSALPLISASLETLGSGGYPVWANATLVMT